jgi:phosphopantetheine adenylyltransferase
MKSQLDQVGRERDEIYHRRNKELEHLTNRTRNLSNHIEILNTNFHPEETNSIVDDIGRTSDQQADDDNNDGIN